MHHLKRLREYSLTTLYVFGPLLTRILVQEVDQAFIPSVAKAGLRDGISKVQKQILEAAKAASAGNKTRAIDAAKKAATEAVNSDKKFIVLQLDIGLDNKAAQEAFKSLQKAYPDLPALFVSVDATGAFLSMCCLCRIQTIPMHMDKAKKVTHHWLLVPVGGDK